MLGYLLSYLFAQIILMPTIFSGDVYESIMSIPFGDLSSQVLP